MYRGTTPTIVLKFVNSGLNVSEDIKQLWLTFKNLKTEKTFCLNDFEIDVEENTATLIMSQEDTLEFMKSEVKTQLRILTVDNYAMASNLNNLAMCGILKEGVIT